MEGDAGAAILQVLVQNLIDSSKKEISLIRGLEKDAETLTASLDTIQKFLNDAEMRTVPDERKAAIRSWLEKLEDAAFDADNVLDEVNYHRLSKNIKKKNNKVLSCFSFSNHISRPRKMALRIKEIGENLDSINKEAAELGLAQMNANAPAVLDDVGFETDSYTLDPIFIGRDGVVSEIVDQILTAAQGEREISVLSIVGMGGLGKTTLTRKVFNHQKIESRFGSRIWVHVSKIFDPNLLLKKILKELSPDDKAESRQDTLKKVREVLKDKTYLLVLDDVWNEDSLEWENFMNALLGATTLRGNAIVVTTRNTNVASTVNPLGGMHQLEVLSEEDCWSIIKEKTFGKGEDLVPSEIESIGRKIAKRCQGSPLAANVVGGVLLRDKSKENWLSIQQNWLSNDDGGNITRILRLSFDSLSSAPLKKCFAYCSMFPKGYKMDKQELIEQWMAEGFLGPDDGSDDMESLGEKFINILLHNSLLQVAWRDDSANVMSCSMHDLVHDLARSVLGSSDRAGGSREGKKFRVRYMLLDEENSIDIREKKYVRTVVMEGLISGANYFSDFEGLHVLTLCNRRVEELPSSIRKLIHLRKLNISRTRIKNLPEWIGELHYLQTLRAANRRLVKVPSTIKYLTKLRHLYLDEDTVLPAEIGLLISLQTLRSFGVGDENGCKIEDLGNLNKLKGALTIGNLERVRNKEEAAKANLFEKSKISELCLSWARYTEGHISEEDVLEGLEPHSDLKKLEIVGFMGQRFPPWIGVLCELIEIKLSECFECEEIPMLGHLPNLKHLELCELRNLKRINSSVYGLANKDTRRVVFPALERLELRDMPKLAEWAEVESSDVQIFPRLQSLRIYRCEQLMSVPTHSWSGLTSLEIWGRGSSMSLSNFFQTKCTLLTTLCLSGIDVLECLPDWLFCENPNLSSLTIRECPKLRELPTGILTLTSSLTELIIKKCPCLKRISDDGEEQSQSQSLGSSNFFTSLRIISIIGCDALVCLPCELVGSSLEKLSLKRLSSLKNLPTLLDCMAARSSRLKELKVVGVPKFMATSRVEVWPFGSLSRLDMDASVGGSMETVDGILQGCCHSLRWLTIRGMEDWDCLPRSIERLTAVYLLKFENFGMEELPEWFGNLSSSLPYLNLSNCKKLRRLPSMDAMRLQTLDQLIIYGCPELLSQGDADPEWPKTSSISYIQIDGTVLKRPKLILGVTGES